MRGPLTRDSVVVVSNDQISAHLGDDEAILHLKSGLYYGLNAVGARIWQLVQQPRTVAQIEAALLLEYDVEAGLCAVDVLALVGALADEGLVEVQDAPIT